MRRALFAAAAVALATAACGRPFDVKAAPGFVELENQTSYDWRATTPDGVVMVPTGPYPPLPGDNRLVPEFFYREAIPPPEVLQPPRPVAPLPQPEAPPVPGA